MKGQYSGQVFGAEWWNQEEVSEGSARDLETEQKIERSLRHKKDYRGCLPKVETATFRENRLHGIPGLVLALAKKGDKSFLTSVHCLALLT